MLLKFINVHVGDLEDNINDVGSLIQAVQTIGDWRGLCTNLGVDESIMNSLIQSTDNANIKKMECLHGYLKSGEATWRHVVRAVAMYPLKDMRLAKKIAKAHGIDFDAIRNEL